MVSQQRVLPCEHRTTSRVIKAIGNPEKKGSEPFSARWHLPYLQETFRLCSLWPQKSRKSADLLSSTGLDTSTHQASEGSTGLGVIGVDRWGFGPFDGFRLQGSGPVGCSLHAQSPNSLCSGALLVAFWPPAICLPPKREST